MHRPLAARSDHVSGCGSPSRDGIGERDSHHFLIPHEKMVAVPLRSRAPLRRPSLHRGLLALLALAVVSWVGLSAREQGQTREFTIAGQDHHYSPSRIEVNKDDLVKVTFTAVDMPHSFNNERYRIAKRAGAGQTVTFEFRADQPGTFEFYCNLKQDERCRDMKGTLVVR